MHSSDSGPAMAFSEENFAVGAWVMVACSGTSRPALVSALAAEKVTVIVPRPCAGVVLQRVSGILAETLQPLDRDQDPEDLERKFLADLMFESSTAPSPALAGAQRAVRKGGSVVGRAAVANSVKEALLSAEAAQAQARSALRSRLSKISAGKMHAEEVSMPAPSTPPTRSCSARASTPKKLRKACADAEACAPSTPPKSNTRSMGGRAKPRKSRKEAAELQSSEIGPANFTLAVGRELALRASGGREAAVTRRELDEKLQEMFTAEEIEQGLKRLDNMNKITLIDGMVFRV